MNALRGVADEGFRYFGASALALAVDFGTYSGLIRLAGVDYLIAAPVGFSLGIVLIYALCVRWVFRHRRLTDARAEFVVFALLAIAGLALNQFIVYAGVDRFGLVYELAKVVSAGVVFCFNYATRKLLLFTKY
jgi:putative flippase GtrA